MARRAEGLHWPRCQGPARAPCGDWCSEGRGTWRCCATRDGTGRAEVPGRRGRSCRVTVIDARANGWVAHACARARVAAPLAGPQAGITCQQHDLANWWGTCPPSVCGLQRGEGPGPGQGWAASGAPPGLSAPFLCWPCWLFFRISNTVCPSQDA